MGFLAVPLASAQPAPAPRARGDFVTVQGNRLMYKGQPIKLKGINFYPKDHPWDRMWKIWRGEDFKGDLARAQELGINVIRIMVPFEPDTGWTSKETGEVRPEFLNQLQQMVQIAGEIDLKVIITLFDFYDPSEDRWQPGNQAEERHLIYLRTVVSTFAEDDRVMAWDIHNEPDQYFTWREEKDPARMIAWMDRMAAEIRRLDPNHLLTVGMSLFDNLFVADETGAPYLEEKPRGRVVADISDFNSFHSYNAGNMDWQIEYITTKTGKPVVLQETGWPSGPPCQQPDYSEERQIGLYRIMVEKAKKWDLAGLLQWQLWDNPGGGGRETHEDYFGLLRRDGTWKPAMPVFRDEWPGDSSQVSAPPLSSLTKSSHPLTILRQPTRPPDPNYVPPLWFPETKH
jgi:endo-1,4-beta-mannosidase